jgi:murein DD-endopeptidase MepM/ murein hydrolase activator NlpD
MKNLGLVVEMYPVAIDFSRDGSAVFLGKNDDGLKYVTSSLAVDIRKGYVDAYADTENPNFSSHTKSLISVLKSQLYEKELEMAVNYIAKSLEGKERQRFLDAVATGVKSYQEGLARFGEKELIPKIDAVRETTVSSSTKYVGPINVNSFDELRYTLGVLAKEKSEIRERVKISLGGFIIGEEAAPPMTEEVETKLYDIASASKAHFEILERIERSLDLRDIKNLKEMDKEIDTKEKLIENFGRETNSTFHIEHYPSVRGRLVSLMDSDPFENTVVGYRTVGNSPWRYAYERFSEWFSKDHNTTELYRLFEDRGVIFKDTENGTLVLHTQPENDPKYVTKHRDVGVVRPAAIAMARKGNRWDVYDSKTALEAIRTMKDAIAENGGSVLDILKKNGNMKLDDLKAESFKRNPELDDVLYELHRLEDAISSGKIKEIPYDPRAEEKALIAKINKTEEVLAEEIVRKLSQYNLEVRGYGPFKRNVFGEQAEKELVVCYKNACQVLAAEGMSHISFYRAIRKAKESNPEVRDGLKALENIAEKEDGKGWSTKTKAVASALIVGTTLFIGAGYALSQSNQGQQTTSQSTSQQTSQKTTQPTNQTTTEQQFFKLFGKVFFDYNGNGKQDPGEPDMPDVVINLDGNNVTKSNRTGWYVIDRVLKDKHQIKPYPPNNFRYWCDSAYDVYPIDKAIGVWVWYEDARKDMGVMHGYLTLPIATIETDSRTYPDLDSREGYIRDWKGGKQTYDGHAGIDFQLPRGARILAAAPGEVIDLIFNELWGNTVAIRDSNGVITHYRQLDSWAVKLNQKISRGELIGYCGSHLHFQFGTDKRGGRFIDPYKDLLDPSSLGYWTIKNDPQYPQT